MNPEYDFDDLKAACGEKGKVTVWRPALRDAAEHFNLRKESDVLSFVANDGLEKKKYINTKPLEVAPDPKPPVDAYEFYSGERRGYFAFFFQPLTNIWNIKSFKPHSQGDDRYFPFADLGKLLGQQS